jgi:hypothetical protein
VFYAAREAFDFFWGLLAKILIGVTWKVDNNNKRLMLFMLIIASQ